MKLRSIAFLILSSAFTRDLSGQVAISGTFQYPDGTSFAGRVTIELPRPTVTNSCVTPAQTVAFSQIVTQITNGTLGSLSLYPSGCLSLQPIVLGKPFITTGVAAGNGSTATVLLGGTNATGTFALNTGVNPAAGTQYVLTTGQSGIPQSTLALMILKTSNGTQPSCSLQPHSANATFAPVSWIFNIGQTQTTMTLVAGSTPLAKNTTYTWTYSCVLPYKISVYDSTNTLLYTSSWSVPSTFSPPVDVTLLDAR